jgi:hypothetical protein
MAGCRSFALLFALLAAGPHCVAGVDDEAAAQDSNSTADELDVVSGLSGPVPVVHQHANLRGGASAPVVVSQDSFASSEENSSEGGLGAGAADPADVFLGFANGTELNETELELQSFASATGSATAAKQVWCVCSRGQSDLVCGGMYYSLMHCGPHCPAVCRSRGLKYRSCQGSREIGWYARLRYRWSDCSESPLR